MTSTLKQNAIRIFISMAIFTLTIFFTPNFNIANIYILIIASIFVTLIDYLVATITNIHDYPIGRGVIGFFSFAIIIYASQFFISGYTISLISSLIASFIYATCDFFIKEQQ